MDTLAGNVWFSKLDANSAYWQIPIKPEDRKKTAFLTKYGLFEHVKMGFGLHGAPSTYMRASNLVLRGLTWKTLLAFLDDSLVLGKTIEEHIQNFTQVFQRFRQYQLKLKPRKCELFQTKVEFLGRTISPDGVSIGDGYQETMAAWPKPTCTKDVERFCGYANYHRMFIPDYARLAAPLYAVTGKQAFKWSKEQNEAFEHLKMALMKPPVLALPQQDEMFILDTDASNIAIAAELCQVQDDQERVITYGSFSLTSEQRRYCTTRKELLSVIRFTRQFRHYLLGRKFLIRTDHSSLRWLMNFKEPQGQLARWIEELSEYDFEIQHRSGNKHINADCLSRLPLLEEPCTHFKLDVVQPSNLLCGGCTYCHRAHSQWSDFRENVDFAISLIRLAFQQCAT